MDSLTASPSLPNTAQKRPLSDDGTSEVENAAPDGTEPTKEGQEELSKRARKRLLKAAKWEATKDERKRQKKEKDKIREQKKKEERAKLLAEGADPAIFKRRPDVQLPSNAKIVIDCDFNDLMTEKVGPELDLEWEMKC